jgi:hypothetical protein
MWVWCVGAYLPVHIHPHPIFTLSPQIIEKELRRVRDKGKG